MVKTTPLARVLFGRCRKAVGLLVLGVFLISGIIATVATGVNPKPVAAATSSNLNFQARLQNAAGGIVADGYYNIEFKLYTASSGGTAVWTEDYYDSNGVTAGNDNRVRVKNGYISVNLGSQTAFGGGIDWSQDMWLTMNVGGTTQTATPTYDGEMNPRLKLTAVPYAFQAGNASTVGGLSTSGLVQLAPNSVQTDASTNSSIFINKTGASGNLLTLQKAGSTVLSLGNTGSLQLQPTTDSTSVFNIKNSTGGNLFTVDSSNTRVGIGLGSNNTPTLAHEGLEIKGSLRLSAGASNQDSFVTPLGTSINTVINVPIFDPGNFSQVLALGVTATASSSSRVILVADGRTVAHQASIGVLSPNEGQIFGLSYDGSNTVGVLKNSSTGISLQGNSVNLLTATNSAGNAKVGIGNANVTYALDVTGDTNTSGVFRVGGTSGATTTCSGGQLLQNQVISGGIVTGGTCAAPSSFGVTSVGAISGTSNANGATITSGVLNLTVADGTNGGVLSAAANPQTIGGTKTFTGQINASRNGTGTGDYSFGITGATINDATSSLIRIGNAIAGGNAAASGGTYIGLNKPSTGAGSAADYLNFQSNGTSQFQVANGGNITAAGTYNSNTFTGSALTFGSASTATIQSAASQALTLTANAASTWSTSAGALTITSAAAATWGTAAGNLTLNAAGGTIVLGTNTTTLQKSGTAFTLDLNNSSNSTFTLTNAGTGVASLSVEGGVAIGSGQAFTVGASTGASTTCSGGQFLQNQVVVGGITTGGTCAAAGAAGGVTSVGAISATSNANGATITSGVLNLTAADGTNGGVVTNTTQTFAGDKTFSGTIVGSSTIQGTQFTSTVATGTAPLVVSSTTKVTNLNADLLDGLDSTAFAAASGSANYIQNTTTAQTNANIAIQSAADGSATAVLKARATQTAALLSLQDSTGFTVAGFDIFGNLSGGQLTANAGVVANSYSTSVNPLTVIQNAASANIPVAILRGGATPGAAGDLLQVQNSSSQSLAGFNNAGQLYLGRSSGAVGSFKVFNATNANTVTVQSGTTGTSYTLTLPTAPGSSGDCLKDTNGSGVLGFGACASTGVTSVGAISATSNANGATITGTTLNLTAADGTNGGVVTNTTQTFAGNKTFAAAATFNSTINTNTFTGSALTFGSASTATIQSAASQALNITGNAASTFSTTAGALNLSGASGISLGSDTTLASGKALTLTDGLFSQTSSATSGSANTIASTNTSGTQTNGIFYNRNGASGTTTNGVNITNTAGTLTNGLSLNGTIGTGINFAGTFTNLISATNFTVTTAGVVTTGSTINGQTLSSAASLTGTLAVAGAVNLNGNTTIGDATTDRLTLTAQVLGGSPIVLQGATDNSFATTLALTDPTANNTITLPNASGTVAVSATGNIALSAAGQISLTGTIGLSNGGTNSTSYTTNGVIYSNGTSLVSTAAGTAGDCLKSNGSGSAPTYGACGTGSSTTMQDTYNNSTSPQITLNSTKGAITYRDASSTIGTMLQLQNNGGTATYFAVTSSAVTMQNTSGVNTFALDSSNGHIRIYDPAAYNASNYADIYYSGTEAVFAASTGTTRVGNGNGNILLQLTNPSDVLIGSKTATLTGAYSANDFSFNRTITGGANSVTGNVVKIENTSTGSSTFNQNLLYINENSSSTNTGNLILAAKSGTTKFSVDVNGNVSGNAFSLAAGQAYTGLGAVSLNSAAATNLTISAGTTGQTIVKAATNSTASFEIQNSSAGSLLTADSSNSRIYIGEPVADANATLLVLDSYTTSTDPTGVNGAMYYNTSMNVFRCYENGSWKDCLSRHIITLASDVSSTATTNFQDVTGLSFAVSAGRSYRFKSTVAYTNSATTIGSRWAVNGPANSLLSYYSNWTNTSAITTVIQYANAYDTGTTTGSSISGAQYATTEGLVTPTASGTLVVRMAPETATAGGVVAKAGSTLEWW